MQLCYRILADIIVVVHMAYVLVVVFGLLATWIAVIFRWSWARNAWWRCVHLTMIVIVVTEAWLGIPCPLTIWERNFRELAGQETYAGGFFAKLVHDWLFYDFPKWVFTATYTAFGLLVLLSFLVAPPKISKSAKSR